MGNVLRFGTFDVGPLLSDLNIHRTLTGAATRFEGAHRLALQGNFSRRRLFAAVASLQMSKQGALVIIRDTFVCLLVRKTRILHLRKQLIGVCSHGLC